MKYLLSILLIYSISFSQELTVDGNLNVTGNIQNQTIDSLLTLIQSLLDGGSLTPSIGIREYTFNFSALAGELDTIFLSDLTGYNLDKVVVEIVGVEWTTNNDQDITVQLLSNDDLTSITKNFGYLEVRGYFDGLTEVMGFPRNSSSMFPKTIRRLMLNSTNPYLLISPYSYNGSGGQGNMTIWVYGNYGTVSR